MKTPEQEAKALVEKFYDKIDDFPVQCGMYCQGGSINKRQAAKQCALICIELMLNQLTSPPVGGVEWSEKRIEHLESLKTAIEEL